MDPICHRCGRELEYGTGSFYVVRIEAIADPSPPRDTGEVMKHSADELIAQMSTMSEQELMDQVYRRLVILLCRRCYTGWIEHPAG